MRFEQLSYSQRQMVNHFEYHAELTTKDGLFRNLLAYAQLNKLNVFDYVPLTFVLDLDAQTYYPDFEKFVQCYGAIDSVLKADDPAHPLSETGRLKLINAKLQQITFSKDRRAVTHCKAKVWDTHIAGRNLWILKPTGFNRGRGVTVFDTLDKLKTLIKEYSEGVLDGGNGSGGVAAVAEGTATAHDNSEGTNGGMTNLNKLPSLIKSQAFVVQKYIEKPLLLRDRKFDIRVWVLVTHEMKVYFFKEGYLRTSSTAYTMEEQAIEDRNVHLTNNAVQKNCETYGRFEDGNQMSFAQFQVSVECED
jgi:hypothetical protein